MAFGKQSGPPASHQQINDLLELLESEGYSDFRDARGPMGFTQRQAGGKFSKDEAQDFIDQLEAAIDERNAAPPKKSKEAKAKPLSAEEQAMRELSSEALAKELRRRGWTVTEA